jgi:hypothetical protein
MIFDILGKSLHHQMTFRPPDGSRWVLHPPNDFWTSNHRSQTCGGVRVLGNTGSGWGVWKTVGWGQVGAMAMASRPHLYRFWASPLSLLPLLGLTFMTFGPHLYHFWASPLLPLSLLGFTFIDNFWKKCHRGGVAGAGESLPPEHLFFESPSGDCKPNRHGESIDNPSII